MGGRGGVWARPGLLERLIILLGSGGACERAYGRAFVWSPLEDGPQSTPRTAERLGAEAAEHDRVHRADAGAGQHGDGQLAYLLGEVKRGAAWWSRWGLAGPPMLTSAHAKKASPGKGARRPFPRQPRPERRPGPPARVAPIHYTLRPAGPGPGGRQTRGPSPLASPPNSQPPHHGHVDGDRVALLHPQGAKVVGHAADLVQDLGVFEGGWMRNGGTGGAVGRGAPAEPAGARKTGLADGERRAGREARGGVTQKPRGRPRRGSNPRPPACTS